MKTITKRATVVKLLLFFVVLFYTVVVSFSSVVSGVSTTVAPMFSFWSSLISCFKFIDLGF
ncbi:MAG: hypothetical protein UHK60_00710 [Acutalibacteraceae bacterium]|nr:hypothetical protein [Acutalibacteraceae bacterium]